MSYYTCLKCGAKTLSKCVHNRQVFIQETAPFPASVLHLLLHTDVLWSRYNQDRARVTFIFPEVKTEETWVAGNDELVLMEAFKLIRDPNITEEVFKKFVCHHDWQIDEGECLFGCCKKKYCKVDPSEV